jgi:hypothetical protein
MNTMSNIIKRQSALMAGLAKAGMAGLLEQPDIRATWRKNLAPFKGSEAVRSMFWVRQYELLDPVDIKSAEATVVEPPAQHVHVKGTDSNGHQHSESCQILYLLRLAAGLEGKGKNKRMLTPREAAATYKVALKKIQTTRFFDNWLYESLEGMTSVRDQAITVLDYIYAVRDDIAFDQLFCEGCNA